MQNMQAQIKDCSEHDCPLSCMSKTWRCTCRWSAKTPRGTRFPCQLISALHLPTRMYIGLSHCACCLILRARHSNKHLYDGSLSNVDVGQAVRSSTGCIHQEAFPSQKHSAMICIGMRCLTEIQLCLTRCTKPGTAKRYWSWGNT